MTRILRGDAAANLAPPIPPIRLDASPRPPIDDEKVRLTAKVADLERALARSDERRLADVEKARAAGEAAGRLDADKRAEILKIGLEQARADFNHRLQDLEQLAAVLVRSALAKVFHDGMERSEDVLSALRHWIRSKGKAAEVRIRLSQADFDEIGTTRLADELGEHFELILADNTLARGACLVEAQIGNVDIAPLRQWHELEKAFQVMLGERLP